MAISGILTTQNHYNQRASGLWPTSFYVLVTTIQRAIFGYGFAGVSGGGTATSVTNLVSNTGVVATDTTGVGTTRGYIAAAGYGIDKAIFGFGQGNITNLVSNTGVVSNDVSGVGTGRSSLAGATYGTDKGIFGYGSGNVSITNKVSNTGVVATDTTGVGTGRSELAAAGYGSSGQAIFGFGYVDATGTSYSITNLVSNTGVVSTDTAGVGQIRSSLAAATYGTDKAIFGYGYAGTPLNALTGITNKVSNTGVVATDTSGVGTARFGLAAAAYGGDKAIFGYGKGSGSALLSITNLVSNTGVVATDTTGVGSTRSNLAAAGYSTT
jgi:hypothetical protein